MPPSTVEAAPDSHRRGQARIEPIDKCAKLAVFYSTDYEEPYANVDIYAVDLKDAGPLRSEAAYNVHAVFSKFNDNPSIVFFEGKNPFCSLSSRRRIRTL